MKLGIIKEGKIPVDERVPLTPGQVKQIEAQGIQVTIQESDVRRIRNEEYLLAGANMAKDVSKSDVLLGVKEVPMNELIPNKTYFFFSHTIKKQPYNKPLLQTIVDKGITLIDWECLRKANGERIIGFGRYAGIVGTYNAFRALGIRSNAYNLKKAVDCEDRVELTQQLNLIKLNREKILLTGRGKVAQGAMEILNEIGIRKVSIDEYLNKVFDEAVYCQVTFLDYFKRKDGKAFDAKDFFQDASVYESDFMKFAKVSDVFIAGHFWGSDSPFLFTREDARSSDFNISLVADISCDIDGPVASTLRPSTIEDPLYGYDPKTESETDFGSSGSIDVMAVDNLPCELPRDASKDFGEMFISNVLPHLLDDNEGIIRNATIVKEGEITEKYAYLADWLEE